MEFCRRIGFSLLRIWLGYLWLLSGLGKLRSDDWVGQQSGAEITRYIQDVIARSTGDHPTIQAWYANAAQSYGLPNAHLISTFMTYCEIFLGLVLLLGVFTTLSACLGGLLSIVYLYGNAAGLHPIMYAVAIAVIVSGSAAGYYGIDRHIMPAFARMIRSALQSLRVFMSRMARV